MVPQHQKRDRLLFRRAAHLLDELLEVRGLDGVATAPETVTEGGHELLELLDLQRIRRLVDAEQAGHTVSSRCCATVSLATSMNSSMIGARRCARAR